MLKTLAIAFAIIAPACQAADRTAQTEQNEGVFIPTMSTYETEDGRIFEVGRSDDEALMVKSRDGSLCLRFDERGKTLEQEGVVRLRGRSCAKDTADDGKEDWNAIFAETSADRLILYPPGLFTAPEKKPIELKRVGV